MVAAWLAVTAREAIVPRPAAAAPDRLSRRRASRRESAAVKASEKRAGERVSKETSRLDDWDLILRARARAARDITLCPWLTRRIRTNTEFS